MLYILSHNVICSYDYDVQPDLTDIPVFTGPSWPETSFFKLTSDFSAKKACGLSAPLHNRYQFIHYFEAAECLLFQFVFLVVLVF
jgi:hypothetical protein